MNAARLSNSRTTSSAPRDHPFRGCKPLSNCTLLLRAAFTIAESIVLFIKTNENSSLVLLSVFELKPFLVVVLIGPCLLVATA